MRAAVSGTVGIETFVLFLIIFLWTPPHFWALALVKSGDYARAGKVGVAAWIGFIAGTVVKVGLAFAMVATFAASMFLF